MSDDRASDADLIRLIAGRNEPAFLELYQRYSAPVFAYLLRLIHEPREAEDLLQEVFVAVWRGASAYRGQAQVRTWLYRIAHNQAVSWFRQHRPSSPIDEITIVDSGHKPEDHLINEWQRGRLRQAVDRLSHRHREVLELAFGAELPYADIAKIVGCPVGTVKSRMSYALKALKRFHQEV
jgi:RNA polymerase sigma-70 factor (ECF subfamily)